MREQGLHRIPESRMGGALRAWGVRPVIAHRGASGYLPEHTLPAYALGFGLGADFLEPDVVITRDLVPICLHDVHLERVTDVAQAFPGRARPDGRYYVIDFTLDEIRALSATGGQRHGLRGFVVPTLAEVMSMATHLVERMGRPVGLAPELKAPAFHSAEGIGIAEIVARALREGGFADGPHARCIVQCFEADALVSLREEHGMEVPRLQLLEGDPPSSDELDQIALRAEAIGPSAAMIEATGGALVKEAHARNLGVIPYTFKEDEERTRRFFEHFSVDGLFSDFPDVALRARDA